MPRALLALVLALAVGLLAGGSAAAPPAWDVSGTWIGFVGDVTLTQAEGALSGTFQMKVGCTEAYTANGTISGSSISLRLARASGGGDTFPCAGSQTLSGTVDPSGAAMLLTLSNRFQTSPPGRFEGKAKKLGATAAKSYPVFLKCKGGKQLCPKAFAVSAEAPSGTLTVQFTMSRGHCSDVRVRISVDGGPEKVSAFLGPGKSTPAFRFEVGPGQHRVRVRAEGRRGGCNKGALLQWAGTLRVGAG